LERRERERDELFVLFVLFACCEADDVFSLAAAFAVPFAEFCPEELGRRERERDGPVGPFACCGVDEAVACSSAGALGVARRREGAFGCWLLDVGFWVLAGSDCALAPGSSVTLLTEEDSLRLDDVPKVATEISLHSPQQRSVALHLA
jgi:hypothetical protein